MKIFVHIKEKVLKINCGEGAQCIRWLGDTAVLRYSDTYALDTGHVEGMRLENGKTMDINMQINEILNDAQHCWITLRDDLESGIDNKDKKKATRPTIGRKA